MGIIFCIVLLTVGSGFEDLTYGLCIIISAHVLLRNDYGNVLSFLYTSALQVVLAISLLDLADLAN